MSNPFIWWDCGKGLALGLGGVWLFLLFCAWSAGELASYFWPLTLIMAAACLGLTLLAVLVLAAMFRNRYAARMCLDRKGVSFAGGSLGKAAARAVGVAGFALGADQMNLAAMGTGLGLVARSGADLAWGQVRKLTPHPWYHAITVSNRWRPVLRLYCANRADYEEAMALARQWKGER